MWRHLHCTALTPVVNRVLQSVSWAIMLSFCSQPAQNCDSEGFLESCAAWNPDACHSVKLPGQLGLKSRSLFQRKKSSNSKTYSLLLFQTEDASWINTRSSTVYLLQKSCLAKWPAGFSDQTHQRSESSDPFLFRPPCFDICLCNTWKIFSSHKQLNLHVLFGSNRRNTFSFSLCVWIQFLQWCHNLALQVSCHGCHDDSTMCFCFLYQYLIFSWLWSSAPAFPIIKGSLRALL